MTTDQKLDITLRALRSVRSHLMDVECDLAPLTTIDDSAIEIAKELEKVLSMVDAAIHATQEAGE